MSLIETLTRAADAEQLRLHPLPPHAAVQKDEHLRRHYALLLAALLTAQPQVSENQSRLLLLLLDSLQLGDIRAALFEQARTLDEAALVEAARLLRTAELAENLLLDALVLLRLEAPLNDEAVRLIGELAAFLDVKTERLQNHAHYAAEILGLNNRPTNPLHSLWPEMLPRALTLQALQNGLKGGLWYLESDLQADFAWQAQDATLVFAKGVALKTIMGTEDQQSSLKQCRIHNATLNFSGLGNLQMDDCQWHGSYSKESSALSIEKIKASINKSSFSTNGATAILTSSENFSIHHCQFIDCKAKNELAGAIILNGNHPRSIFDCYFENCAGSHGGAIYLEYLRNISACKFTNCTSQALEGVDNLAIYTALEARSSPSVENCIFQKNSLYIASAYHSNDMYFVRKSNFISGNIYFYNRYSGNSIEYSCTFQNGSVIEKKL